jgi:hypothetical protein
MPCATRSARLLLLCFLAACSSGGNTEPNPDPVGRPELHLDVIADGVHPEAPVGSILPGSIVIRVTQRVVKNGVLQFEPAPAQLVNFAASDGGSVFVTAGFTNELGEVLNQWTLGTKAGVQRLEARAMDPETGEALTLGFVEAEATPGPVVQIFVRPIDALHNGDLLTVSHLVDVQWEPSTPRDQYGNAVTDLSGLRVAFRSKADGYCDCARSTDVIHALPVTLTPDLLGGLPTAEQGFEGYLVVYNEAGQFLVDNAVLVVNP